MNPKPFSHHAGIALFALFLALLSPRAWAGSDMAVPITTSLNVVTTPSLGAKGVVNWRGIPEIASNVADLKFLVTYPDGTQRKMAAQRLTLAKGKLSQVNFTFSPPRAGAYTVISVATIYTSSGRYAKTNKLRFNVPRSGLARLEREPQMTANQMNARISGRLHQKPGAKKPRPSMLAIDPSGFKVFGKIEYIKKYVDLSTVEETGFSTKTMPMRFARVLICDDLRSSPADNPDAYLYQVLGETRTDANGNYSFSLPSNDDGVDGGRDIFLEIYADSAACKVADFSGVIYRYDTEVTWDYPGGTDLKLDTRLPLEASGPWSIVDTVVDGYNLVKRCGQTPPKVTVRWTPGNELGTWFDPRTKEIMVRGDSADPDEFDDAVIEHEYGHFITDTFSISKSPGGDHYWDRPRCRELAWSEGFASFFSCAARNDALMFDMLGGIKDYWLINVERPSGDYPRGDDVEGAVAASLWDIFDGINDYHDTLTDGMTHIWPIIDRYFTPTSAATMQDFYNGWGAFSYPNRAKVRAILDQHGINYWGGLMVDSLLVNNGEQIVPSRTVTLDNLCSGSPLYYMVSETATFDGAIWRPYSAHPTYTLTSPGNGPKTLFFKVRNAARQVSPVKVDFFTLNEQRPLTVADNAYIETLVPTAGSFDWYKIHISKAGWYSVYFTWFDSPLTSLGLFKASDVSLANPIPFTSTYALSYIYEVAYLKPGDYLIVVLGERPITDTGSFYRLGVSVSRMAF